VGELGKLGITASATLVRNALARAGIPPAPERAASGWRSFLRQHGNTILACGLFTVDIVWLRRVGAQIRFCCKSQPFSSGRPSLCTDATRPEQAVLSRLDRVSTPGSTIARGSR
jgi:hypothetical protein